MRAGSLIAVATFAFVACKPDFGGRDSLVTSERLIAVITDPPEAAANAMVTFTAIVVDPNGSVVSPSIGWAFCASPKTTAENDVVSRACLGEEGVHPAGGPSPTLTAPIPSDACSLFGPVPPPGQFRPHDPDTTGGYYQPMRVSLDGAPASFALERVSCSLANAPTDAATEYGKRYVANTNPHLAPLAATIDGAPVSLAHLAAGARVTLTASWSAADAEAYVSFDLASQSIVDRREAMRVSWFTTAGSFDSDHTGRDESDAATSTDDGWTAPSSAGIVHIWMVLRDSRGGIDVASYDVNVESSH